MNVAGSANAKCIVEYLSIRELRTIFFQALPILRKTQYKFRASKREPQIKILMQKTYKEKVRELETLARLID
jgi:hypothetical protein